MSITEKGGELGRQLSSDVEGSGALIEKLIGVIDDREQNSDWMQAAACKGVDPKIMYPSDNKGIKIAKEICAACLVSTKCLDYAIRLREKDCPTPHIMYN